MEGATTNASGPEIPCPHCFKPQTFVWAEDGNLPYGEVQTCNGCGWDLALEDLDGHQLYGYTVMASS